MSQPSCWEPAGVRQHRGAR